MTPRAAVYLRQSLDGADDRLGVSRQRDRTDALIRARGWQHVQEYVDNDVSASKARGANTAWARMLNDARHHMFDLVVAVDVDRLLRGITDLSALIELGVRVVTVDGEIDLTTADGEFRATMLAAIARFEVRRKSERQKRANAQRRAAGVPAGGRAPYGYASVSLSERTRSGSSAAYAPVRSEAEAVTQAYRDFAAGASIGRLVREWNAAGRRTPKTRRLPEGGPWTTTALRRLLLSPFYAALIPEPRPGKYDPADTDVSACVPGAWPPLVDRDTWLATRERLLHPARRTSPGTARRWLLAGLARCAVCDSPVTSGGRGRGVATYRCPTNHFSRLAKPLDEFAEQLVIARLNQPDAADLLRPRPFTGEQAAAVAERAILEQRARSIVDLVADGTITADDARDRAADLRGRIAQLDLVIPVRRGVPALASAVEGGAASLWTGLPLDARRAVIDTLAVIHLTPLGRGRGGARQPISATTTVTWRDTPESPKFLQTDSVAISGGPELLQSR